MLPHSMCVGESSSIQAPVQASCMASPLHALTGLESVSWSQSSSSNNSVLWGLEIYDNGSVNCRPIWRLVTNVPCDSELMRITVGLVNNVTWVKTILNGGSITGRSTLLPARLVYNFAIQCLKKHDIQEKKNSLRPILHPVPRILGPGAKLRSAGLWTWWPFQRKHSGGQTCGVTGERQVTHFKDWARIPSVSWVQRPSSKQT